MVVVVVVGLEGAWGTSEEPWRGSGKGSEGVSSGAGGGGVGGALEGFWRVACRRGALERALERSLEASGEGLKGPGGASDDHGGIGGELVEVWRALPC